MAYHSKRECEDTISEVREEKGKTKPVKKDHARVDKSGKIRLNVSMDRKLYDKLQGIRHDKGLSLEQTLAFLVEKQLVPEPVPTPKSRKGKSVGAGRYIPKRVRAEVIKRDLSRCSICKSTHKIQLDHATPIAHGGKSEQKNLRLLCRNCNLRAGIKVFGLQAMKR
jgi:hypothetical protein